MARNTTPHPTRSLAEPARCGRTASRIALALALLALVADFGCARSRGNRRLDLGALTPPLMIGSRVRSQDGTQLARRGHRRPSEPPAQVAQNGPRVQWTDPPPGVIPQPAPLGQPAVVTLPPPPTLPTEPGAIASASPAAKPSQPPRPKVANTSQTKPKAKPAVDGIAKLQTLLAEGHQRIEKITNYQVLMERQERVGDDLLPAEEVVLSIRRDPKAVRLEWRSGKNQGREVLYSTTETDGQLQIHTPGSLIPRMTLAPDSPLVLRSSRHPITEAGLDAILESLEESLRPHVEGTPTRARMTYQGIETPEPVGRPCDKIVENRENGEVWTVYLDAQSHLPAMVQATTASGELLEHYVFHNLKTDLPELAQAGAFDPETRWGAASEGFFSRMARSKPAPAEPTANSAPQ